VIKTLPAPVTIRQDDDRVSQYLLALGALSMEVARRPALLPVFLRIVALVPGTIIELVRPEVAAPVEQLGLQGQRYSLSLLSR
jgi:hypothetical protein